MTNAESPPTLLWAQRTDKVMVSIQLGDVTEETVEVTDDKFTFKGTSNGKIYELQLELNNSILPNESIKRKGREYYIELKKKVPGPYWPRLLKDTKKHPNIKVDFNRWKDESDEDDDDDDKAGGGGKYDDASLESMMQTMGGSGMPPGGLGGGNFDPGEGEDDSDDEDFPDLEA